MTVFLLTILWCVSGIIPGLLTWRHLFRESLPVELIILSAISGPIAGAVHLSHWCD